MLFKKVLNLVISIGIIASVYHPNFDGKVMSNECVYDHYGKYTAASNVYPFNTVLEISYQGKKARVVVTDHIGVEGRIDLSGKAMHSLTGDWCSSKHRNGCVILPVKIKIIKRGDNQKRMCVI